MKIIILASPDAQSILSSLKNKETDNVTILNKIDSPQQIESIIMGQNIVILPENADDAICAIIGYCNEFRSPKHGKIPLILLNDNKSYQSIVDGFLRDYRRIRPDVPPLEADEHYLIFKKTPKDFFVQTPKESLTVRINELIQLYAKPQSILSITKEDKNNAFAEHEKLTKLRKAFSNLIICDDAEKFKKSIVQSPNKSVLIIGAGDGQEWDRNNRAELYQHIGQSIATLGYSKIISGGPDGCAKSNGPMYQSAIGAAKAEASLSVCYTSWIFENLCDIEKLIAFGNVKSIAFALNEPLRQAYLIKPADLVMALPGALGTFSEILATIIEGKEIILCNMWIDERHCYYYESFYQLLKQHGLADHVHMVNISSNMNYKEVFESIKNVTNTLISSEHKIDKMDNNNNVILSNSIFKEQKKNTSKNEISLTPSTIENN